MLKPLTRAEFYALFEPEVHEALREVMLRYPDAVALVVFENRMMDSSAFGHRTAGAVGPSNTFKTIEACEGKWLNDLPSQRQHATSYILRDVLKPEEAAPEPPKSWRVLVLQGRGKTARWQLSLGEVPNAEGAEERARKWFHDMFDNRSPARFRLMYGDDVFAEKDFKLSDSQREIVQKLRTMKQPLVRLPGGFWTYKGCEVNERGVPSWDAPGGVQAVRALERKGWLKRTNADTEAWKDERQLAE